jgi:predicted  nucleic acid-binding Zn-ribbon protein
MLDKTPGLEGIGVYKSFEITTRGNGNYTLKNLNVVFKVEQDWLSKTNVDPSHVKVFGIDGAPQQFEARMINQKGKYYFFSTDLNKKGKYAIGVTESKMLETKLKERFGQIESKHKNLNDKVDNISNELSSKNKSQQKLMEDNVSKIRGELNDIGNKIDQQRNDFENRFKSIETRTTALENTTSGLQKKKEKEKDITDKLSDIGTKIEQQRKDFENKTRNLDTSLRNLTEQVKSLRNEKAETKRSQEEPSKSSAARQELTQGR